MANALSPLKKEFGLSPLMVGIVVSSLLFAGMLASPFAGSIADSLGRKKGIAIASALICAGNLLWAFAPNIIVLLAGRIVLGFGIGIGIPVITNYMAEVAPVNQRGLYVSLEELFINCGILAAFAAGALITGMPHDWRIMVGIAFVLPFVTCIVALTSYLPESPRFLQATGRTAEARAVLLDLLHGDEEEVDNAFAKWEEESRMREKGMTWTEAMSALLGSHSRAFMAAISVALAFFLTGVTCVVNYAVLILTQNGMSNKSAAFAVVVVGVVKVCALVIPIFFLLDRWGRRPVLLSSVAILACACGFVAFGTYAGLGGIWVAVGLCAHAFGFSAGIGPTYYVYVSEVFDNVIRAKGGGITFFVQRLTGALTVLFFPILSSSLGIDVVFWMLAGCNVCAFICFWFFCLETKGVPLESINEVFQVKQLKI